VLYVAHNIVSLQSCDKDVSYVAIDWRLNQISKNLEFVGNSSVQLLCKLYTMYRPPHM